MKLATMVRVEDLHTLKELWKDRLLRNQMSVFLSKLLKFMKKLLYYKFDNKQSDFRWFLMGLDE
ncbi:MAG: hypothetical protein J6A98_01050 [Clostridia bacterium]|nr:hypothetical protein [Clostridia bacterium]